ncbi:MAG: zinc-dependent peptidase [Cyclobacteriaceae bacterium]|nr:zinc-dependent peptidase [Cyclobacteriaceae bacterium]
MLLELLAAVWQLIAAAYDEVHYQLYFKHIFHRFLSHKYPYYAALPKALKSKFLRLVRDHYRHFDFVARDKMKLTRAMKAIIASAVAQLVLFLPTTSLTFFERIIVYPDFYHSKIRLNGHLLG